MHIRSPMIGPWSTSRKERELQTASLCSWRNWELRYRESGSAGGLVRLEFDNIDAGTIETQIHTRHELLSMIEYEDMTPFRCADCQVACIALSTVGR